ncbi:MAG TPA: NAD(P)-binding protein, partial [Candidatus Obscuribacter sp.]|nr:NAD(P)-binding protein [Candidatus Obscuribacter sp.]
MKSIGIVGSGIAGLGLAYQLRDRYDITIFEGNSYVGGHTNTIDVDKPSSVAFDTGFMVFNHVTYPLLT